MAQGEWPAERAGKAPHELSIGIGVSTSQTMVKMGYAKFPSRLLREDGEEMHQANGVQTARNRHEDALAGRGECGVEEAGGVSRAQRSHSARVGSFGSSTRAQPQGRSEGGRLTFPK